MATSVTGSANAGLSFQLTPDAGFNAGQTFAQGQSFNASFRNSGALKDQVEQIHAKTYSLAGATQTINLASLVNLVGESINFARVRAIGFRVRSTNDAHQLKVGAAASSEWVGWAVAGSKLKVCASSPDSNSGILNSGYAVIIAPNSAGMPVGGANGTNLMLDPGANTFDVDVIIAGSLS